ASSDLEEFGFLVLDPIIDFLNVLIGQVLQLPFSARSLILTNLPVLDGSIDVLLGLAAYSADRHASIFTFALDDLHHFFAAFLGELRNHHTDHGSIVTRIYTEIG